jgi:hypothetical protein
MVVLTSHDHEEGMEEKRTVIVAAPEEGGSPGR